MSSTRTVREPVDGSSTQGMLLTGSWLWQTALRAARLRKLRAREESLHLSLYASHTQSIIHRKLMSFEFLSPLSRLARLCWLHREHANTCSTIVRFLSRRQGNTSTQDQRKVLSLPSRYWRHAPRRGCFRIQLGQGSQKDHGEWWSRQR